jgi:hypothetical protein
MSDNPQAQIAAWFLAGNSLTVVSCRELFHTTELRRVVSRLKKCGYNITGIMSKDNQGHAFKQYFMGNKK